MGLGYQYQAGGGGHSTGLSSMANGGLEAMATGETQSQSQQQGYFSGLGMDEVSIQWMMDYNNFQLRRYNGRQSM